MLHSHRNKLIGLHCKLMGWFLYEYKVGRKWVNKARVMFNLINSILVEPNFCKRRWLYFNDSCYYFSPRFPPLDFHNARNACRYDRSGAKLDAELVSIENEAENKFVSGQMRR